MTSACAGQFGSISGTVTDAVTRAALWRAQVTAECRSEGRLKSYRALTQTDGRFTIAQLPPCAYQVFTAKTGFYPAQDKASVKIDSGEEKGDLNLRLNPGGVVTGRVTNADGEPVEDAIVILGNTERATTDDQGRFRFGGVQPGRYRLTATPARNALQGPPEKRADHTMEVRYGPALYPSAIIVEPGQELRGIELQLPRTPILRVSGRVLGSPGPNSQIWVSLRPKALWAPSSGSQVKPDGTFEIWRVNPGVYEMQAQGRDLQSPLQEIDLSSSNLDNIELHLVPPFDLSGTVRFEDDRARPDGIFNVRLSSVQPGSRVFFLAPVQPDGSFVFRSIQPGRYALTLLSSVFAKSLDLGPRHLDGKVLDLRSGGTDALTIVASAERAELSGKAPSGQTVMIRPLPQFSGASIQMSIGEEARYRITLTPGKYRISLVPRDLYVDQEFEDAVEITLAPGEKHVHDFK